MKTLNIQRDQVLLESLVNKYGKSDVVKYINKVNEDNNTFDSDLVPMAPDFKKLDKQYTKSLNNPANDIDWSEVSPKMKIVYSMQQIEKALKDINSLAKQPTSNSAAIIEMRSEKIKRELRFISRYISDIKN